MPLTRTYQGRILSAQPASTDGEIPTAWQDIRSWQHPLAQHHAIFQDAINYYLVAIAGLAEAGEKDALGELHTRVTADEGWSRPLRRDRGLVNAFGPVLGRLLGLNANPKPTEVFAHIYGPHPELAPARHLAGLLLLSKCQGDAGIQQGGRGYWPRLCNASANPTYDFSASTLQAEAAKAELAALLHDEAATPAALLACASELDLSWTVKIDPGKFRQGEEARARLREAVTHFTLPKTLQNAKVATWCTESDFARLAPELLASIAQLPDTLTIPKNRKASLELTFGTLLFQHFPSPLTAGLLRLFIAAPKKNERLMVVEPSMQIGPNFTALGDDPIKLARGERGFVFPAFTALPSYDGANTGAIPWTEFDIAAFKEALKAVNQFRLKTEERAERRQNLKASLDYQMARVAKPPRSGEDDESATGKPRLGDDPRYLALQAALADLSQSSGYDPDDGYGLHRNGLRGWRELEKAWRKVPSLDPDQRAPLLDVAVTAWQRSQLREIGSVALFRILALPAYQRIWADPAPNDAHCRARDVLWASCLLAEDEEEFERLASPVQITPADAASSPRQFMFTDIKSKHAPKFLAADSALEVSLIGRNPGEPIFTISRARLTYSAPRLNRDGIGPISAFADTSWLPPLLMPGQSQAKPRPQARPQKAAVAFMPQAEEGGIKRMLLNFPVTIDNDALAAQLGRPDFWRRQFNRMGRGASETLLHLLWPGMKNAPMPEVAWWQQRSEFQCLAIDLGQRSAAAAALMEARADTAFAKNRAPFCELGTTGDRTWRVALLAQKLLKLPGEDRPLPLHERTGGLTEEPSGKTGRRALASEWTDAREIASRLGWTRLDEEFGDTFAACPHSFPELNDRLLRCAGQALGRIRTLHRLSIDLANPSRRKTLLEAPANDHLLSTLVAIGPHIDATVEHHLRDLQHEVGRALALIADRILPQGGKHWQWVATEKTWQRLEPSTGNPYHSPTIDHRRGQRGLPSSASTNSKVCASAAKVTIASPASNPAKLRLRGGPSAARKSRMPVPPSWKNLIASRPNA